jgi:hypothetical protein
MTSNLVLVAYDGQPRVVTGSNMLLETIRINYPKIFQEWKVFVVTPTRFSNVLLKTKLSKYGIEFVSVDFPDLGNFYMNKAVLLEFAKTVLNQNDVFLYLDYDHICLRPFSLPSISGRQVFVGSKVSRLSSAFTENRDCGDVYLASLGGIHYNSSIIYAERDGFMFAGAKWIEFYERYKNVITERSIEEVAFSLSSVCDGYEVLPISDMFQQCWGDQAEGALFHYGGDGREASYLKQLLNKKLSGNDFHDFLKTVPQDSVLKKILNIYEAL